MFKFNPFTGNFDMVGDGGGGGSPSPDNFSYEKIIASVTVTIPLNQQMIVNQNIQVDGTLVANGTLVII